MNGLLERLKVFLCAVIAAGLCSTIYYTIRAQWEDPSAVSSDAAVLFETAEMDSSEQEVFALPPIDPVLANREIVRQVEISHERLPEPTLQSAANRSIENAPAADESVHENLVVETSTAAEQKNDEEESSFDESFQTASFSESQTMRPVSLSRGVEPFAEESPSEEKTFSENEESGSVDLFDRSVKSEPRFELPTITAAFVERPTSHYNIVEFFDADIERNVSAEKDALSQKVETPVSIETNIGSTVESGIVAAVEPKAEPEIVVAVEPKAEPGIVVAVEPKAESEIVVAVEPKAESEIVVAVEPKAEPEIVVAVEPKAESEIVVAVEPKTESKVESAAATEMEIKIAPAAEPAVHSPAEPSAVPADASNECWMICGDHLYGDQPSAPENLRYWKADGNYYQPSDAASFLAGQSSNIPTVILIHGNLADTSAALRQGQAVRQRLERVQCQLNINVPFRLVIWKWPSEKMFKGIRTDSQFKASLADASGFSLATLLARFPAGSSFTMIGFSFGARTAGSSLELLAGGSIHGRALSAEYITDAAQNQYRLILFASAANYGDFGCGGKYHRGTTLLSDLLEVYNPTDKALKFYPLLYKGSRTSAMGVAPINSAALPENLCGHACSINASCLGPEHDFYHQLSTVDSERLAQVIFGY